MRQIEKSRRTFSCRGLSRQCRACGPYPFWSEIRDRSCLGPVIRGASSMPGFLQHRKETPRLGTLRKLLLFSTLSRFELGVVDALLHERTYLKGEIIFDEGEEAQALYAIMAGRVLICRKGEPDTGRITEINAGVVFGELALLDDLPRSAQARAADDCVLASLSRGDFERLLDTHAVIASKIALQLARHLGRQLRDRSPGAQRTAL